MDGLRPEQQIAVERVTHDLARGNQAIEVLRIGFRMRAAQRQYFKDKTKEQLLEAKRLEKLFDDGLASMKERS